MIYAKWRRPRGTQNDFLGFKCHFLLTPTQRVALAEHVEMTLFNGGYAGLDWLRAERQIYAWW